MSHSVVRALELAFSVFVMMAALANVVWSMTAWATSYDYIPTGTTVFIEDTKIPEEINWTGDQVVAKLYRLNEENVPIVVDGRLFQSDLDVKTYQSTVSLQGKYKKTIEWDSSGQYSKIIFTSK